MWSPFVPQYLAASYLTNPEEHNPSSGACSFNNAPVQTGSSGPPIQWVRGYFGVVHRTSGGFDHTPLYSHEVKERVELYLFYPSGPAWPILW